MSERISTPYQRAIDVIETLPPEEQETLIDLIRRRLIERRRAEIARHAADSVRAVREGRAQFGAVEDVRRALAAEE